jgi:hypothetical protein
MDVNSRQPVKLFLVALAVGIGALILVITATIIVMVVAGVNRSVVAQSEVYHLAVEQLESHTVVTEALGQPISPGPPERILFFTNLAVFGQADFVLPVSGPNRSGSAMVSAEKQAGEWVFTQLTVVIEGDTTQIDLLDAAR